MSDSEGEDWFDKDLDDFVAPVVPIQRQENESHINISGNATIQSNPFELFMTSSSGGNYDQHQPEKVKSKISDAKKLVKSRLQKLLNNKPGHIVALDLFINSARWKNSVRDYCHVKDADGLDMCLQILQIVNSSPLIEIKREVLLITSQVPDLFTWHIRRGLTEGYNNWQYRGEAMQLLREIGKMAKDPETAGELKWFLDYVEELSLEGIMPNCNTAPSIYPELKEFDSDSVALESLPQIGSIDDPNQYLRIQMNLLREELLHDLRELIHETRTSDKPNRHYSGIKLSRNELFEVIICDPPPVRKECITGTLLLLSTSTNFNDLIVATVTEFNSPRNELKIELISIENTTVDIFDRTLVMLICPVFFEPIYRVHEQLNSMIDEKIPFQDILLKSNKTFQKKRAQNCVPVITGLYPRQVDAVTAGVSQTLTLIQGPPGTGKSFMGRKIIENLLAKSDDGKKKEEKILIISVTNHALDEVLKGLLPTTQRIVRFGTQSKERELDEFNVNNIEHFPQNPLIVDGFTMVNENYQKLLLESKDLAEMIKHRKKYLRIVQEIKQISTLFKIESKCVLGMTTTAAARLHILLELYKPRVLIAEEAAEILECHTIAALTKSMQQIILIGDHHQLRATLQVPKLATKYFFDVSLFERLIHNGMEVIKLNQQSRMRPELAHLVRGIFYDSFENNAAVENLPSRINGVEKNIFFFDHNEGESVSLGNSKINIFEADFSLHLVDYLLKQGYDADKVVLLSFYNGHLDVINGKLIGKKFRHLKGVRSRTVDNFQGEESDIVILNAVRSNEESSLGHVAVKNRICAAMTRAKYGLFIIGNATVLQERSVVWREILQRLRERNAVGNVLPLKCQRHGNRFGISSMRDFDELINRSGGCAIEKCNYNCTDCGNDCDLECHPVLGIGHECGC